MKLIISFWKTIIWAAIVVFLSISKGENIPHPTWLVFPHIDKVVHFVMYFVLATVLIHDLLHFSKINIKYWQIIVISIVIVIGWGGFLEILQRIPGIHRSSDFFDFLANTSGAIVASIFYRLLEPILNKINALVIRQ